MKKLLFALSTIALVGAGCFPACVKSHVEKQHYDAVENYSYVKSYWTGLPTKVFAGTTPAYDEDYDVCDEYEK